MRQAISHQGVPFTQVANVVLNDKRLSMKAKGLFAYLYSKPDGYDFSFRRIMQDHADGRDAVLEGLKELESFEYLTRTKQSSGRVAYMLSFAPDTEKPDLAVPDPENPKLGKSQVGKIRTISKTDTVSKIEEKSKIDSVSEDTGQKPGNVVGLGSDCQVVSRETISNDDTVSVLNAFRESVNPGINFGNKTERKAAAFLVCKFGLEKVMAMIEYAASVNGEQYAPVITSPYELQTKLGKLIAYKSRKDNKPSLVATI